MTNRTVHLPKAIRSDIICDERGTLEPRVWLGDATELGPDFDAVLTQARRKSIRVKERSSGQIEIRGRDRVGIIRLPSGRSIRICTKLPGIVLLEWLAFLGEFPDLETWSMGGNVHESDSFQKVIARLFLGELDFLSRVHLRKGFVQFERESSHVQGRILSHKLAQRPWRLPAIPQIVRARSIDTPANKTLANALDALTLFLPELDHEDVRRFQRLRSQWAIVSRQDSDRLAMITESQSSPPDGYRTSLQLARLILRGASIDPKSGSGGQTFTVSLARVWEHAVTEICRKVQMNTKWKVMGRSNCSRLWDDSDPESEHQRSLIVDTLLANGDRRWILDAKYKLGFGHEGRNDRFQMCAYALAFHAERATLVYPTANDQPSSHRVLLDTLYGRQRVLVDAIGCNMALGPKHCMSQLRAFMNAGQQKLNS